MKYKLVIFDFDGTLADTFPWALTIMDEMIEKFDIKNVDRSQLEMLRHFDAEQLLTHVGIPLWKLPKIARYLKKAMADEIHLINLFPGVDAVIKALKDAGIKLALVTSNSKTNAKNVLGEANMAQIDFFDCGVSMFGKASKLRNVARKSGFHHHEVLCIGDEIRDIRAAHEVNMAFGAVSWGYTTIEALMKYNPEEVFHSVEAITEKILN